MILRPNQTFALAELDRLFTEGKRRICVTSPTGGGKSLIMFHRIEDSGLSTGLYTDRRMLFKQIHDGLEAHGVAHGLRASGVTPELSLRHQLCMIQTEGSRSLGGKRDVHPCQQVIVDESHKNSGDTMQQLIAAHEARQPDLLVIGVFEAHGIAVFLSEHRRAFAV